MSLPTAKVTLELPVTLDSIVKVAPDPPPGLNDDGLNDWLEDHGEDVRLVTLGELIAETLIAQADPTVTFAVRARLDAITDDELRLYARHRIMTVMTTDVPGALTGEQLTLAARVEREIRRQITAPDTYAHGREATVVEAVIQTAVTNAFRDLASDTVAQVRDRVLADIARHARSDGDPIPPGG